MTTLPLTHIGHDAASGLTTITLHFDNGETAEVRVSGADGRLSISADTADGIDTVVDVDEVTGFGIYHD